ncbi:MAG: SurA N-terminal domain-containing protein [Caulobacteraceae bacterium]|nr:SurA N-terminal domain-containing protein [Caulobacteraceae bacterium]
MLAFFRAISKSWVANVFFVVLIISFAAWGIRDAFHPQISTAVVSAGSHEIQPADFKRMFENYRKQMMQQSGQMMTAQDAVAAGVDQRMLQELSGSEALAEFIHRLGILPSDKLVADQLKKQPMFFDSVTGKFDEKAYEQTLAENGLTPDKFLASLTDEIAQDHLGAGLAAGLKQPLAYGAVVAGFQLEGRTLSYFLLDPHNVQPPSLPTDQQLQALINQHADQLKRPEMRVLSVVRLSAKALAPSLTPNPADLQKMYNFRKDSLSTPEKRSLVEIPAKDAATAQAIAARLQAGQAADVVAKAYGVQPIAYTDAPKSAVADPKVADVAFGLQNGQVSGAVQTGLAGLAVVKVTAVTPAKAASFDELKPQLEAQARSDMATQKIYDQVQKYDDAHSTGATLADAARAAGAAPVQLGPISAQGVGSDGQPVQGLSPKLLKQAFALAANGESDMMDDGAGEYFAVHVDKVIAPAVPALDEIRKPLTQYWMSQEMIRRLNARAGELAAKIRKGETLEAAAAEVHAQVGHAVGVTRVSMQQNHSLGQALAEQLFTAKAGDIITGQTAQIPVMVARLDSVSPPAPAEAARMVVAQRDRATSQMFADLGEAVTAAAKTAVKPTSDLNRARTAMGVSPDDLPKAAASGAKPARAP